VNIHNTENIIRSSDSTIETPRPGSRGMEIPIMKGELSMYTNEERGTDNKSELTDNAKTNPGGLNVEAKGTEKMVSHNNE
jgi:hypothetical protein